MTDINKEYEKEYYDEYRNNYYNPDDDDAEPGINLNWKRIQRGFHRAAGNDQETAETLSGVQANLETLNTDVETLKTDVEEIKPAVDDLNTAVETAEQAAAAAAASEAAAEAAQAAAEAVEASIPQEYTALSNNVDSLTSDFDQLVEDTIEVTIGKNKCPAIFFDGYLGSTGSLVIYDDWKTTDYIDVSGLSDVVASAKRLSNNNRYAITMFYLTTYDSGKGRIEQVSSPTTTYAVGENVKYIRFSFHSDQNADLMVESGTSASSYEPYEKKYKAVNNEYALKVDVDEISDSVDEIETVIEDVAAKDYQLYNANFSLSPSAIWDNGVLINTLENTKTTDYIDCSDWIGIRYTGSNWLGARALAFFDENYTWISSMPAEGETTAYNNEIVNIPKNAKYVVFADLTAKVLQTLRIEVAEEYKIIGKWTGKKWTCVGDSLTESNLRTSMNYHGYVSEATGITVVNMGRSGTGYMRTYDEGYAFYQRIANVPTDSDVVTIFGSGNDLLYISDLGSPTDSGAAENPTTICGCINKTIDTLIEIMPTVQLGIVAPTPWVNNQPTLDNSNPMGKYVEALRQICYIRSIPFLDLYHESNLRPWTAEGRAACYTKDEGNGVHPDETGHRIIASRFEGFLDSLLLGA